ncbi:T-cell differentiation antigen CD6-like isoform X2 [Gambusia affinis]|uniref:T-cell differentiation antigen CD6-like isoform X2 n=1 Tax=Gambusia affinis TaxID=33528 RepID=UPI001CDBFF0E|nr:T-cell differentiation antigen CD6-like isoform X2 [Gambusia affinis]
MKLLQFLCILQLSSLSPALLDASTPDRGVQVAPEDMDDDPYVHHLGSTCRWTLRMPGDRSGEAVPLPPDFLDTLTEWICQDLKCGRVYSVNKFNLPPKDKCFQDCVYQDQRLQNCSETFTPGCIALTEVVCGHQSVRLKGHEDQCAGRVEVWKDGNWGTVCDDRWDLNNGDVVCEQLDCGVALRVTGQNGLFPPGSGPIHLEELNCTGNEQNLWFCPGVQENSICGHKEDAGVVCSDSKAFFGETTEGVTELMTTARPVGVLSPERLSMVVLALGLLVFAILNLVLCCLYRRRHVLLLQQTRSKQAGPSDPPQNLYKVNQNLVRAGTDPLQATVPSESRTVWSRTRRADSGPGDPDCEPSVRMSTFHSSGAAADGRTSGISEDSFDSSSTSSGECYENVTPSQNPTRSVTSEPGQNRAGSPPPYTNTGFQFALRGKGAEPSSGDDEDEDDYCPVSPD